MQPLINLKSFLAALLILILPAAILVAYFRNYSPDAAGHEHGEKGKGEMNGLKSGGESHAGMEHGSNTKGDDKVVMEHGNMAMSKNGQIQPQQQEKTSQPPAEQPQKDGGHAAMGHGNTAQHSTAQVTPQPDTAAAAPVSAQRGVGSSRSAKSMSSMGAGVEAAAMQAMGRVKTLTGRDDGTVSPRLFHVGAKDFFLDHAQLLTLSAEQEKTLNQIKEQALLGKASVNRKIQEAEQQLWKSTSADRPNPEEIEAKVRQVEKLRADQRIGFIRAIDQSAKVLNTEQRQSVIGGTEISKPPAE